VLSVQYSEKGVNRWLEIALTPVQKEDKTIIGAVAVYAGYFRTQTPGRGIGPIAETAGGGPIGGWCFA